MSNIYLNPVSTYQREKLELIVLEEFCLSKLWKLWKIFQEIFLGFIWGMIKEKIM